MTHRWPLVSHGTQAAASWMDERPMFVWPTPTSSHHQSHLNFSHKRSAPINKCKNVSQWATCPDASSLSCKTFLLSIRCLTRNFNVYNPFFFGVWKSTLFYSAGTQVIKLNQHLNEHVNYQSHISLWHVAQHSLSILQTSHTPHGLHFIMCGYIWAWERGLWGAMHAEENGDGNGCYLERRRNNWSYRDTSGGADTEEVERGMEGCLACREREREREMTENGWKELETRWTDRKRGRVEKRVMKGQRRGRQKWRSACGLKKRAAFHFSD